MKIYARIHPKMPHQSFFRCGYKFGKKWTELDIDKATAVRLRSEQMLDVSDKRPTELSGQYKPDGDIGSGQGQSPNPAGTTTPKSEDENGSLTENGDADGDDTGKSEDDDDGANGQTDADAKQADADKTGQTSSKKGK